MTFFGFRGGVHPPENKIQTEHLPIEKLESPDEIFVPLLQHIGAPLNPLVNVGDRVLKGQKNCRCRRFGGTCSFTSEWNCY